MKRRDKFDYILLETTGMADSRPVAQTCFVDDEMQARLTLDGIVTLVDAKHVWPHIDDSDEVKEQIAFADVILLNKTDLVSSTELDQLERRIHGMNAAAKIYRTQDAVIDMDSVLNVGGFNLGRAMEVDPLFMELEYPFEWGGVFHLKAGRHEFRLQPGPDPAMTTLLLRTPEGKSADSLDPFLMEAALGFSAPAESLAPGWEIVVGQPAELHLEGNELAAQLSWDQRSKYLATAGSPQITVWDCSGKGPRGTTQKTLMPQRALRYQEDGPLLASGCAGGEVAIWRPSKRTRPDASSSLKSPSPMLLGFPNVERLRQPRKTVKS
jgi:hypothetical protein